MKNTKANKPVIIIDTREKEPYQFKSSKTLGGVEVKKLESGDYSLKGAEDLVIIERKANIDELKGNLGKHRERFERELDRLKDVKFKFVVVEDYYSSIWRRGFSRMNPNAAFESIIGLEFQYGVRFKFCGSRQMGHKVTRSLLLKAHKYREKGYL